MGVEAATSFSASASSSLMVRGSASLARRARFSSSVAISFSDATATAIISRPSSVLPMLKTFTRGLAFSSMRM